MKNKNRLAILGLVLLFPAALLVFLGFGGFPVPRVLDSPLAIAPGLALAMVLNLLAVSRINVERDEQGGLAAWAVRVEAKAMNLAVLGLCSALAAVILGYLFLENFQPR